MKAFSQERDSQNCRRGCVPSEHPVTVESSNDHIGRAVRLGGKGVLAQFVNRNKVQVAVDSTGGILVRAWK